MEKGPEGNTSDVSSPLSGHQRLLGATLLLISWASQCCSTRLFTAERTCTPTPRPHPRPALAPPPALPTPLCTPLCVRSPGAHVASLGAVDVCVRVGGLFHSESAESDLGPGRPQAEGLGLAGGVCLAVAGSPPSSRAPPEDRGWAELRPPCSQKLVLHFCKKAARPYVEHMNTKLPN